MVGWWAQSALPFRDVTVKGARRECLDTADSTFDTSLVEQVLETDGGTVTNLVLWVNNI